MLLGGSARGTRGQGASRAQCVVGAQEWPAAFCLRVSGSGALWFGLPSADSPDKCVNGLCTRGFCGPVEDNAGVGCEWAVRSGQRKPDSFQFSSAGGRGRAWWTEEGLLLFCLMGRKDPSLFLGSREGGRNRGKVQEMARTLMEGVAEMGSRSQVEGRLWKRGRGWFL